MTRLERAVQRIGVPAGLISDEWKKLGYTCVGSGSHDKCGKPAVATFAQLPMCAKHIIKIADNWIDDDGRR